MVRRLLPLLGPVGCGLGIWLFPDFAGAFEAAAYGSLATLLLAAPALLQRRSTADTAPSPASEPAPTSGTARSSSSGWTLSLPSLPRLNWGRVGWGFLTLSGAAALIWMFVSFGAMVVDPEQAVAWSFHMLGSLFTVLFLAPLIVFLQPSSEPEAAVAATRPAEPATEEADESASFIPSLFSGSDEEESSTTEPAAASEPYDESELRSIWSYAEEDAARERSASGDGAANRTPQRPSESAAGMSAASTPSSNGATSNGTTSTGSASGTWTGGWPWAEETQPASSSNESAEATYQSLSDRSLSDRSLSTSSRASNDADTQWADSMWPPEDDNADSGESQASSSSSSSDDDTWPPANWPSLDDYDY